MAWNQIPTDEGGQRVRLELSPRRITRLAGLAAKERLSVAALSRLVMGLVADGHPSGKAVVEAAYAQARGLRPAPKPAGPKRRRGRPKKLPDNSKNSVDTVATMT
jgi:hypothetical protein